MPDSIREQIVAAFATRMGGSTIRGSVQNNMDDVVLGPVTGVIDGDDEGGHQEHGSVNLVMSLRVERIEEYDEGTYGNQSTHGNAILASLIETATSTDRTLGGLCTALKYSSGGVDLSSASSDVVGAYAVFDVPYKWDVGDPFTDSYPV